MTLAQSREWMDAGTTLFVRAVDGLPDEAFAQPCTLPGWTRAHLIAHIVGNARALTNLATWARTGVETPMYASFEQRDADIEAGAALAPADLRARFAASVAGLADSLAALSDAQWDAEVRTIQGRTLPASTIPWLRSREVLIHVVDLDAGVGFDDCPDSFLVALIDDIVERRSTTPEHPALVLEAGEHRWEITGQGSPVVVSGTLGEISAYLTGRSELGPVIPAWL